MLASLRRLRERLLLAFTVLLLLLLALLVVVAVICRKASMSLSWCDGLAVVLLAWITYYGTVLASLKRAHIGFPKLVGALPRRSGSSRCSSARLR